MRVAFFVRQGRMAMEHDAEICCAGADRNQNGATLPSADPKWASRGRRVCSRES